MRNFRKFALIMGAGALVLSGSMSLQAAPKDDFDAAWTSKEKEDLDDAIFMAVTRSPDDVGALIEVAFGYADAKQRPGIVAAAMEALKELDRLDCDLWTTLVTNAMELVESYESKGAIYDAAKASFNRCDPNGSLFIGAVGLNSTAVIGGAPGAIMGGVGGNAPQEVIEVEVPTGGSGGNGNGGTGGGDDGDPIPPPPTPTPAGDDPGGQQPF